MSSEAELKTIGQRLREAREDHGWTLEEAARRTKLKKAALEYLEKDQFEYFPSLSNARGFIRLYARELGIDGWDLLRHFEGGTIIPAETYDLRPEDLEAIPKRRQPLAIKPPRFGVILFLGVFLVALVIGGVRLYQIWPSLVDDGEGPDASPPEQVIEAPASPMDPDAPPEAEPVNPDAPPAATPVVPSAEPVTSSAANPPPAAIPVESNQLQLMAFPEARRHQLWVRVIAVNGEEREILYQDLLPAGQRVPAQPWEAQRFIVKFGEASMVNIIFNGVNEGPYERAGVQEIRLPGGPGR